MEKELQTVKADDFEVLTSATCPVCESFIKYHRFVMVEGHREPKKIIWCANPTCSELKKEFFQGVLESTIKARINI